MDKLALARQIAANEDVSTPPDSVVLYSISYQPTDENKRRALRFLAEHPGFYTLDDTVCGQKLMALGLETGNDNPNPELLKIWATASQRFILAASGNITAFVDNADKRSTFVSVELPLILQNDKIKLINGTEKHKFAAQFGL